MELTAILVDDEEKNLVVLEKMLDMCPYKVKILGMASTVKESKKLIDEYKPDIVFLDVEMPGGNGFRLLDMFETVNFEIIFTTAHDSYALKAFKYAATDYLLKPLNYNELLDSLKRVYNKVVEKKKSGKNESENYSILKNSINENFRVTKLALSSGDGIEMINVNNIIQCQADRSYCTFYLKNGKKIVISKALKEYEEILEDANFFRVHKSNMINLNLVKKYVRGSGGYVIMVDDSTINVSVRKKEQLLIKLSSIKE